MTLQICGESATAEIEITELSQIFTDHVAVVATGYLSPNESLALLRAGHDAGVCRMVVAYAFEPVPGMSLDDQRVAVETRGMVGRRQIDDFR